MANEDQLDKRYQIEPLTSADTAEVIPFLRKFFFEDEPLNYYLGLGDCPELEVWATKYIKDNCSFKAVNTQNQIIGVILNGIVEKTPQHDEPEEEEVKHEKFKKILTLFDYIDTQYNMFDVHPQFDRALDAKIMSVNDAYRGVGICKELTRRTVDYMREHDLQLFHVMCTSFYSSKVCESLGFDVVYKLNYKDYKVNGKNILLPAEPHDAVRCCTRII